MVHCFGVCVRGFQHRPEPKQRIGALFQVKVPPASRCGAGFLDVATWRLRYFFF
jgi:hypothetical protein